jgi:methylenetetrahydrofolate reductase (NADPH)
MLPRTFHIDLPEALAKELNACATDAEAREVGIAWCTQQALELKAAGVPSIHFYSMNAVQSVAAIARNVY